MFANGYRCFACGTRQSWDFTAYQCPECSNNLDITYDYPAIAENLAQGFPQKPSGVFRYQSLLPVSVPAEATALSVGASPMVKAGRLGAVSGLNRLYLKDDSRNPSASLKDRGSAVVVQRAIDIGAGVISAASTGNAGSSLACLAAARGCEAVIFVPQSAPPAKLTQSLSFGATVLAVRGNYDAAFDLCRAASEAFGWFNRSTGLNPFTREGKKTCAFEIWEDLGGRVPDRVVVATGDGNILSAVWKGWLELKAVGLTDRLPKIDCAQSDASAAIGQTVTRLRSGGEPVSDWTAVEVDEVKAGTIADSISVDRPRDGLAAVQAIIESGGATFSVPDEAILAAVTEMSRLTGIFPEPAAATTWVCAREMANQGLIDKDELTVCIVSGNGLKDIASASKATGKPQVIDPDIEAVKSCLNL